MTRTLIALLALGLLAGCAPTGDGHPAHASTSRAPTPTPTVDPLAGLSLQQRVGQLFVVGSPATAAGADALADLAQYDVGSVFLSGRSSLGTAATKAVVDQLTAASASGIPLLVSTDQEGGTVQVLRGSGFSAIPSAVAQGALDPATLQGQAAQWGAELASAGVNLDLAPVSDVVPSPAAAPANAPIGALDREFGFDQQTVEQHAAAFSAGMLGAGVLTTPKHFPGLGDVTQNTDDTANVTDTTTTADSPSVRVTASLIQSGVSAVMVSTAIYSQLDPGVPAAFSPTIVTGLLRQQMGFRGVVITDDLSGATQVLGWSPEDRAILSIEAGDDLVLVSRDPQYAAQMIAAVVAKAQSDPVFDAKVDAAARRVLALKAKLP
jgi:beta-N-acetylhexosaminidase